MKSAVRYGILAALLIAVIAVAGTPIVIRWLRVDACLDSGGAWDHDGNTCSSSEEIVTP